MIAKGMGFERYKHEWMGEGPLACGHAFLDDDIALGIWLMAGYREHAHAGMSEYAHAVEEAIEEAWRRVRDDAVKAALAEGMDREKAEEVAEYALDGWSNQGDEAEVADAVSCEYLEDLKESLEEWLEDEERSSDEYDPEGTEIMEKKEWLATVSERLAKN